MTDKVKQLAPKILAEIQKSKSILLHCHPSPDGDSYGSALAVMHTLKNLNKKVTMISGDSPKPRNLSSLPGFEEVTEKNYLEINQEEFDLFIILDSSAENQISKKGEVIFPDSMRTIVIDHHASNQEYAQINLVDTSYIAVSQIIYDLLCAWEVEISPEAAVCLFVGMYTDSGGFKYALTSPNTLFAAAAVAKINPGFPQVIYNFENSAQPGEIKYLGLALSSVKTYFSKNVAIASVSFKQLQDNNISKEDIVSYIVSNYLKSVVGWNIGIAFTEKGLGIFEASLRTRDSDRFDLSKLALALGGGGHKAAAGGKIIAKNFAEASKVLLETIEKTYPELGKP